MSLKLYNSLSREIETFVPENPNLVTMYTCGPTVYDYQHIGNLRTAILMDVLRRTLNFLGYKVDSVMNVTDVEDKIENKAKELKAPVNEIVSKYEKIYFEHLALLNIYVAKTPHASENIAEQISLIKELESKGIVYKTPYGVYFDTSKDPEYGKLGNTYNSDRANSRIDTKEGKKNSADFVLWRVLQKGESREKTWDSPWGVGYPGWHIECSAMSYKTLTKAFSEGKFDPEKVTTIDIHVGGSDLREIHHENEIAQSECASGKKFVKYWVHGGMLVINSAKMSKSLNNFFTLKEVITKGYNPLDLRYFYYSGHYRKELNFTWEALENAANGYKNLKRKVAELQTSLSSHSGVKSSLTRRAVESNESNIQNLDQYKNFVSALQDDINIPKALSVVWETADNQQLDDNTKIALIKQFDEVMGLKLLDSTGDKIPKNIQDLAQKRQEARKQKDFDLADKLRQQIEGEGFEVEDTSEGFKIIKS